MADDFAMNFRRNRGAAPAPAERRDGSTSTVLIVAVALMAGFGGFWFLSGGTSLPLPSLASIPGISSIPGFSAQKAAAPVPAGPSGPRFVAPVAGVRESAGAGLTGLATSGRLALSYLPVGPVVFRMPAATVEVDGPRLMPPPIGRARTERAVLDHGAVLARELASLSSAACDSHLRHLAAANVTLFIAGFFPPRTPINAAASPDTAFWQRPEASTIRRTVADLAAIGAFAQSDFGLDASPQAKGLFVGVGQQRPACT
ncbi:hypothetical protein [Phreatobacter sp.]|uniref:hypothetical protein n=1 Tax=Phreatobacter sp. TaxID=1966341 RepID=UPI003F713C27